MYSLYRDDDISVTTNICLLEKVHSLFLKYNKVHTIALQMKDVWDNKEVWYWMMTAKNLSVGLHGWEHKDHSVMSYEEICADFNKALEYWKTNVIRGMYEYKPITVFFPTWNKVSENLLRAAKACGLTVDNRQGGEVYNFHYWGCLDNKRLLKLEMALSL